MTHVLVYESEPPLFCLLRTGKFRQSSGVALGEDGRCRGAHLQTGGHTPPVFRRRAPVRTPLAVGVLPFLHVVFGFESGEEAPMIPSGVAVFRIAREHAKATMIALPLPSRMVLALVLPPVPRIERSEIRTTDEMLKPLAHPRHAAQAFSTRLSHLVPSRNRAASSAWRTGSSRSSSCRKMGEPRSLKPPTACG